MKYRKKPVIIEAVQWFPDQPSKYNIANLRTEWECGVYQNDEDKENPNLNIFYEIDTLEGKHLVKPGDWIITGVKGETYPCKPDIFEMTYEKVI